MKIDSFGLASMGTALRPDILRAVGRVVDSGTYILGPEVEAFECEFAEFVGTRYCVLVANGLDALHLALAAAGVGPGDEVIVPTQTFVATLLAPLRLGATVVAVDVHPVTGLIDLDKVADAIGPKTAAVVPVHLHGAMVDMLRLRSLAETRGLVIIEDAAQAHGARTGDSMAGSLGTAGAFSFYPTKNLGALGDAGCVTTDDPLLAAKIRSLRNYSRSDYARELPTLASNSRTDEVQAAILREMLPRLNQWNESRRKLAGQYLAVLQQRGLSDLTAGNDIDAANVFHHFALLVPDRELVLRKLGAEGIQLLTHYSPLPHDILRAQFGYGDRRELVVHSDDGARLNAKHTVSLPLHPFLATEEVLEVSRQLLAVIDGGPARHLLHSVREGVRSGPHS